MEAVIPQVPGILVGSLLFLLASTGYNLKVWDNPAPWVGALFAAEAVCGATLAVAWWMTGNVVAGALTGSAGICSVVMLWHWWRRRRRRKPSRVFAVVRDLGHKLAVVPAAGGSR